MPRKTIKVSEDVWQFLNSVKYRKGERTIDHVLKRILMEDLELSDNDIKRAMEEAGFGEG